MMIVGWGGWSLHFPGGTGVKHFELFITIRILILGVLKEMNWEMIKCIYELYINTKIECKGEKR